jgi:hypothetical protein
MRIKREFAKARGCSALGAPFSFTGMNVSHLQTSMRAAKAGLYPRCLAEPSAVYDIGCCLAFYRPFWVEDFYEMVDSLKLLEKRD